MMTLTITTPDGRKATSTDDTYRDDAAPYALFHALTSIHEGGAADVEKKMRGMLFFDVPSHSRRF